MKTMIFAPAAVALFLASTAAFGAWTNVTGKVTNIDVDAHTVTLDNGKTYTAQDGVDLSGVQVGDNVTLSADHKHGKDVLQKIDKSS